MQPWGAEERRASLLGTSTPTRRKIITHTKMLRSERMNETSGKVVIVLFQGNGI